MAQTPTPTGQADQADQAVPASDPVADQGTQARELGLSAADCPYSVQGENRTAWFAGFGEDDPEAPQA